MDKIPVYPKLISTLRRRKEKFLTEYGCMPNAVLLGTDKLGAIFERKQAGMTGEELVQEGPTEILLEGLLIIPDGRDPKGVAVARIE